MTFTQAFVPDELKARHLSRQLGAECIPGFSDQIGDRILVLDERHPPAREVLLFRETLTASPGFEVALRRNVERLKHFRHPSFGPTPSVEYLGQDRCLALVSAATPGQRLSNVLAHAHSPALAASLIDRLLAALDALNSYSGGSGHGALTASRVVIAPDGQPTLVEYVLGSALERLHLTADASLRDLGIPLPPTEAARTDFQTDCYQLAQIALAMLLGRRLSVEDNSDLRGALNAATAASDRESTAPLAVLAAWLARALQLDGREFLSNGDARAALRDVAAHTAYDATRQWQALCGVPVDSSVRLQPDQGVPLGPDQSVQHQPDQPERVVSGAAESDGLTPEDVVEIIPPPQSPVEQALAPTVSTQPIPDAYGPAPEALRPIAAHDSPRKRSIAFVPAGGRLRWAMIALAVCAVAEALVIAWLLAGRDAAAPPGTVARVNLVTTDPGAAVVVDGRSAGVTPLDLSISSAMRTISVAPSAAPKQGLAVGSTGLRDLSLVTARTGEAALRAVPPAAPPNRVGAIKVVTPIQLDVFEGDRRLGSSKTGIVTAAAGRRELDFVNSALGFRSRQIVDVRAGRTVELTVTPPNGRININAVPWAEVLIAGKSVGETPIGNLSIPLGEHEIVFRHPQLGEVRRMAVVRLDAVTLVSANLQR